MKRIVFASVILAAFASPSMATEYASEQQTLTSAHEFADLFQGKTEPFDLEVAFTAQFKGPIQGHISLKWKSEDQWRRKIEVGGFQQVTVKNGEMVYTTRNSYTTKNFSYTPPKILQIFNLLGFKRRQDEYIAQKRKDRAQNDVAVVCVQADPKEDRNEVHDVCIDASTHDLLSDDWQEATARKSKEQFSDYAEFNEIRYPRKLELFEDEKSVISANVTGLQPIKFDPSLLVPPKGATVRRECPDIKPAVAVNKVPPTLPGNMPEGEVSASFTVLTDGSIENVQITQSDGSVADNALLGYLKNAKYKPAMCGTEPIVSDGTVAVTILRH
jgi:TonB family protein